MLSFNENAVRTAHTEYFLTKVEVKDTTSWSTSTTFFDQPVKKNEITWQD